MWVSTEFPGDNNQTLKDVQHRLYGEMVVRLFIGPRDRYLAAARLLRVDNELSQRLQSMDGFDHRTLQSAHDRIAASFRLSDDGGQLRLGEREIDYCLRLEESWRAFIQSQVGWLAARDDEFVRAICTATAFGNKEPGVAAEQWLDQFLRNQYPLLGPYVPMPESWEPEFDEENEAQVPLMS